MTDAEGPPRLRIIFNPERFMRDRIVPLAGDDEERFRVTYAQVLKDELQPLVSSVDIRTNPRNAPWASAGGPGGELDAIDLVVKAVGAYTAFRFAINDLRKVMERIRSLVDGPVVVDSVSATYLAIDSVTDAANFMDIELTFQSALRGAFERTEPVPIRGWVIGLVVNGEPVQILVAKDGSIIGRYAGLPGDRLHEIGVERVRPWVGP